jgi:hypothetical protein
MFCFGPSGAHLLPLTMTHIKSTSEMAKQKPLQ